MTMTISILTDTDCVYVYLKTKRGQIAEAIAPTSSRAFIACILKLAARRISKCPAAPVAGISHSTPITSDELKCLLCRQKALLS